MTTDVTMHFGGPSEAITGLTSVDVRHGHMQAESCGWYMEDNVLSGNAYQESAATVEESDDGCPPSVKVPTYLRTPE